MDWLTAFFSKFLNILPSVNFLTNPLQDFKEAITPFVNQVNYFIPIQEILQILIIWVNLCIVYFGVKFLYSHVVPFLSKLSLMR